MGRRGMPLLIKEKHGSKDGEVLEVHCLVCIPLSIIFNVLGGCSWTLVRLILSLGLLGCLMPFGNRLSVMLSFGVGFGSGGGKLKKVLAGPLWSHIRMTGHGRFSPL